MVNASSEISLLLCCARTVLQPQHADHIRSLIQQKPDLNGLVRMARVHRVVSLLYHSLSSTCPDAVPEEILCQLRSHSQTVAAQNLHLLRELLGLLSLFKTHDLAVVPFKGPVVAATVYGDLSLREFLDLDLLVQRHEVWRARDLLMAQGYQPAQPMNEGQEAVFLQYECGYTMFHEAKGIVVDLHWSITRKYMAIPLTSESLWPRLMPATLANREVLSFSSEDLLLILCVHGSKHLWTGLDWICDVATLINHCQNLAWDRLMRQAENFGCVRFLLLGLYLAHDLFDLALPAEILQSIRNDSVIAGLARQVCARLFSEPYAEPSGREKFVFLMCARERLRDKTQFLLRRAVMPTARDVRFMQFPVSLAHLYLLLRPIRFVREMIVPLKPIS